MRKSSGLTSGTVLVSVFLTLLLFLTLCVDAQQFNYEVEKRILDRLDYYLGDLVATNQFLDNFRDSGGFPNDLKAPDRDLYLKVAYALDQPLVYFGLEDGQCTGYYLSNGYHREPGNDGYDSNDPAMQKHLKSCVNTSGEPVDCLLPPGAEYIQCVDGDCEALELCADEQSQTNCGELEFELQQVACERDKKWCRKYTIEKAFEDDTSENTGLGFVPLTNFCHDDKGRFTQEVGVVLPPDGSPGRGNCYYGDGATMVNRFLEGPYDYCGLDGQICNNTFSGGYASFDYDPRYRPWYYVTKELQVPNWLPPYPFFDLGIGITFAHPIYSESEGKKVFDGVLSIDYRFEDIANFLIESYGDSSTTVVIYEADEPNYVIGSSTGSDSAKLFLTSDLSKPCPVNSGTNIPCTPIRVPMSELSGDPMDSVLVRSYQVHENANYPQELLTVKDSEDPGSEIFVSQSTTFEQAGAQLRWRVIITSPGQESSSDAITVGNQLFPVIILIGGLGLAGCLFLFGVFYSKRKEKAVIYADWRFTLAFIMGCVLLNGSTFTLLGSNTDSTCLLRRWTFHLFFVMALAPLFIKVWRIKQLVGMAHMRRNTISNYQAALYTLPMIMTEVIILTLFTFVDPLKQTEMIENSDGVVLQRIVCDSETSAFFIVQVVYEAGVVLVGCILAYLTRNMDSNFGESKQLIFAMYNIALISTVIVIVISVTDMDENGKSVLQAIGVFWGTVFSAAAFVIPRMMQVREQRGQGRHSVQISGLSQSTNVPSVLERIEETAYESTEHYSVAGNQASSGLSNESDNSLGKAEEGLSESKSVWSAPYNDEDERATNETVLQDSTSTFKDDMPADGTSPNASESDDELLDDTALANSMKSSPSAEENGLLSEASLVENINSTPAEEQVQLATIITAQDSSENTMPAEGTSPDASESDDGLLADAALANSMKSSSSAEENGLLSEASLVENINSTPAEEQVQLATIITAQDSSENTMPAEGTSPNVPEPDDDLLDETALAKSTKSSSSAEANGLLSEAPLVENINSTPAEEQVQLATDITAQDCTENTMPAEGISPTARDDMAAEGTAQNIPGPEDESVDILALKDSTKGTPSADEELPAEESFLETITAVEEEQLEAEETSQYSIDTTATARGRLVYEGLTQEIAHPTSIEDEYLLEDLLADETEQERAVISEAAEVEIEEENAGSSMTAHRDNFTEEKTTERPTTEEKPVVIESAPVEETPKKESARDRKRRLEGSLRVAKP